MAGVIDWGTPAQTPSSPQEFKSGVIDWGSLYNNDEQYKQKVQQAFQTERQHLQTIQQSKGINNDPGLLDLQARAGAGQISRDDFTKQLPKFQNNPAPFKITPKTIAQQTGESAKAIGKGLVQSEQTVATGIDRIRPGGMADIQAEQEQAASANKNVKDTIALQKSGKISKASAQKIIAANADSASEAQQQQGDTVKSMPSKGQLAAAFAGVGTDILSFGTLPELKGAGVAAKAVRATKVPAVMGASGGFNAAAGGGDKKQIIENALAGAAFPALVGGSARVIPKVAEAAKAGNLLKPLGESGARGTSKGMGEAGGVAPGKILEDTKALVEKHQTPTKFSGDVARGADSVEGTKKLIQQDATDLIKNREKLSTADMKTIQEYRDQKAAGLTPDALPDHLQAHDAAITELNKQSQKADAELARLNGHEDKAKTIEARDPSTYTHREAQAKGSSLDYLLQGDRKNPISVGGLSKTTPGSKSRSFMAITDESGNRRVVAIKQGRVTAIDKAGKTTEDLGNLKHPAPKRVVEFNDKQVMGKLNTLAKNLGINHERIVSNRGNWAGKSMVGANKIITKSASPERTLLHEIGHQIDEKYGLQKEFVNNPETKNELRALTDLRAGDKSTPSFQKYVRKGEEKIATMFEAYIHTPDKFKELAPNSFKKFEEFLNAHDELKAITDIKPSLELEKNVVKTGEDQIPGEFIDKNGNKHKISQATTQEITKATGQKYYVDPHLMAVKNFVESRSALENARFIESIKSDPVFEKVASPPGQTAPKGWKSLGMTFPQLGGYRFEPKVADTLKDIASGYGEKDALDKIGKVLRQTIVYFPVKHDLNMAAAYMTDRGISGIANPVKAVRGVKALYDATREVINHGPIYRGLLKNGFSLVTADNKAFQEQFSKELNRLINDKTALETVAKQLGTSPKRLINAYSSTQHVTVWMVQDILNTARVMERMQGGLLKKAMPLEQAMKQTERFNYQYKAPSRVAGSRNLSRLLTSDKVFFGRYKYDQFKILSNMLKDSVNVVHPVRAAQAWDKLGALLAISLILWPEVNKGIQKISGNPNANIKAPGPTELAETAQKIRQGKETAGRAAGNLVYLGPLQTADDVKNNRDSFTGKQIYDPNSAVTEQGKAVFKWLNGQVAPVQRAQGLQNTNGNKAVNIGLMLSGTNFPKNSPESSKLSSLKYDTLPNVQSSFKKMVQQGNTEAAKALVDRYNQQVFTAAKAAIKASGKPVPSDQQLMKDLKKNQYLASKSDKVVKNAQKKQVNTIDKLLQSK